MSTLITAAKAGARTRVPRFAEAAVERARLTVVPPRRSIGRTQAARTPFAILVISMLVAGVVGLLMFNTNMQQASFKATALQERVSVLAAREQALNMELDALRDPQRLAAAANELGMVAATEPAFIRLADGRVLGNPTPAVLDNAIRITPLPAPKPASLKPRKRVVKVAATRARGSRADTRGASTPARGESGRKKASNAPAAQSGASH